MNIDMEAVKMMINVNNYAINQKIKSLETKLEEQEVKYKKKIEQLETQNFELVEQMTNANLRKELKQHDKYKYFIGLQQQYDGLFKIYDSLKTDFENFETKLTVETNNNTEKITDLTVKINNLQTIVDESKIKKLECNTTLAIKFTAINPLCCKWFPSGCLGEFRYNLCEIINKYELGGHPDWMMKPQCNYVKNEITNKIYILRYKYSYIDTEHVPTTVDGCKMIDLDYRSNKFDAYREDIDARKTRELKEDLKNMGAVEYPKMINGEQTIQYTGHNFHIGYMLEGELSTYYPVNTYIINYVNNSFIAEYMTRPADQNTNYRMNNNTQDYGGDTIILSNNRIRPFPKDVLTIGGCFTPPPIFI